jgi:hypothetical protein
MQTVITAQLGMMSELSANTKNGGLAVPQEVEMTI